MSRQVLVLLGVVVLLAACSSGPGPLDDRAEINPDLVVASPSTVRAGDRVELTFPTEAARGEPWVLEEADGSRWLQRYLLTSDGTGGTPSWVGQDEPDRWGWVEVGVGRPGPDTVLIRPRPAQAPTVCARPTCRRTFARGSRSPVESHPRATPCVAVAEPHGT